MQQGELDRLMAEVGPLDDTIITCVKTPDGAYAIRFDDADVLAEWDDRRKRLVLSAEIGTPSPVRTPHVHATLLSYNLLWRETGGLSMAMTGRQGAVVQMVDLAGPEIEARNVATIAVNLAERTRIWRAYFESEAGEAEAPAPDALDNVIRA